MDYKKAYEQEVKQKVMQDSANQDRIRELEEWIMEDGKRTDTCTRNILKTKCFDCRCGYKESE